MTNESTPSPGSRFGILSFVLMFIPILTIVIMNLVVYPLVGNIPTSVERISIILLAVLPPLFGFVFAIVGLVRKETQKWLHIIVMIFNLLQSIYFGFLAAFAG
jgi:hypothetical protein